MLSVLFLFKIFLYINYETVHNSAGGVEVGVSLNFRYTSPRMRVNTMEDDSVFEEEGEGEERDSFVQPSRGLRSFALVSWLFSRTWKLSLHHHLVSCLLVAVFELGNSQKWHLSLHYHAVLRIRVPDPSFVLPGSAS
jgi:hypothetical protein